MIKIPCPYCKFKIVITKEERDGETYLICPFCEEFKNKDYIKKDGVENNNSRSSNKINPNNQSNIRGNRNSSLDKK